MTPPLTPDDRPSDRDGRAFDFDRIGDSFSDVLAMLRPAIHPVVDRVRVASGERVLDIACGTGEPGLSLARARPDVQVLGVDSSSAMIDAARRAAVDAGVLNITFEVASAEDLPVPSASTGAIVSRFGLLAFGDAERSAAEAHRVLGAGGTLSLTAWDGRLNPLGHAAIVALGENRSADLTALLDDSSALADPDRRSALLDETGFVDQTTDDVRWRHRFESLEAAWDLATGPAMFGPVFDRLSADDLSAAHGRFAELFAEHGRADGSYAAPFRCLVHAASR